MPSTTRRCSSRSHPRNRPVDFGVAGCTSGSTLAGSCRAEDPSCRARRGAGIRVVLIVLSDGPARDRSDRPRRARARGDIRMPHGDFPPVSAVSCPLSACPLCPLSESPGIGRARRRRRTGGDVLPQSPPAYPDPNHFVRMARPSGTRGYPVVTPGARAFRRFFVTVRFQSSAVKRPHPAGALRQPCFPTDKRSSSVRCHRAWASTIQRPRRPTPDRRRRRRRSPCATRRRRRRPHPA